MANVIVHIRRYINSVLTKGTVTADDAAYPNPTASAQFIQAVRQAKFAITLEDGTVIPASTVGNGTVTSYTFQGRQVGGYASGDTGVLNVTAEFRNGRIYLTDHASPQGTPKYLINGRWYNSLQGLSFPPGLPILIQKFMIDTGRSQEEWRTQPVPNAAQVIHIL